MIIQSKWLEWQRVTRTIFLASVAGLSMMPARILASDNDCLLFRSIYDWQVLDRSTLIVWAPSRRQAYLVTLSFPSSELRFADELAFVDRNGDGRLCGFGMDSIIVRGPYNQRLTISGIRRLESPELPLLLDEYEPTRGEEHRVENGGESPEP